MGEIDKDKIKDTRQSALSRILSKERSDLLSLDLYRACLAEFLGVVFLNFLAIGTSVCHPGNAIAISLEAGLFVANIIRILSAVSGGHVNPAVSVGFLVLGQITFVRFIGYSVVQTLGAAAGTALIKSLAPSNSTLVTFGIIYPGPGISDSQALVCEIVITFFLLFGVFAMIDPHRDDINGFAPLQIGLIVTVNVFAAFNISGGILSPARNFGPAMVAGIYDKMWIYWIGDMIGGVMGALCYDKFFSTTVTRHRLIAGCTQHPDDLQRFDNGKMKKSPHFESDNEML